MARNHRIGLIAAAVVVAVLAFVIASPGADDGGNTRAQTAEDAGRDPLVATHIVEP